MGALRGRGPRRDGEEGFSVVEIVVAMTLFAVVATFAAAVLLKIGTANRDAVRRTTATNLAAEQIESIRSTDAADIPDGGVTRTVKRGNTTYSILQTANYMSTGSNVSICSGSGDALAYKLITVAVRWPAMGSTDPIRADTLKTLGVGSKVTDSTKGVLAISVRGALARPTDGVTVTLNPGGQVRTTGDDGCAVYTGLAPGTYTATLNQPNFVDQTNTQNVTVNSLGTIAGKVIRATALYAPGRSFTLDPTLPAGYALPNGLRSFESTPYFNPKLVPTCAELPSGYGCLTTTGEFRNVFPTVYDVWLGPCSDSRAARASLDVAAAPSPSTPTLSVPRGLVDVRAVRGTGQVVTGAQLYAVHAPEVLDPANFGCATGASYPLPLTSSSGGSFAGARVALPPGTWTIQTASAYSSPAPAGSVTLNVAPGTTAAADVVVP